MKLSSVLFVLGFVCLVILKTQPTWLFGERPAAKVDYRQPTPQEQLERMKQRRLEMPQAAPDLRPIRR